MPPRRRRGALIAGIAAAVCLVLVPVSIIGALIGLTAVAFDGDGGGSIRYRPADVDAIPSTIRRDGGEIELDLTRLEPADFDGTVVPVDIALDVGQVRVIVPDDLPVDVTAEVDVGEATVFEETSAGLSPHLDAGAGDGALVELDITVDVGNIQVVEVPADRTPAQAEPEPDPVEESGTPTASTTPDASVVDGEG